jgi:hypothetical protein
MESMDLNINNYKLDDLLNLFNLDYNFKEEELKNTKKVVLKTHPDKSGLEKEYFLFFMKAYEIICQIYYFRGKRKRSTEYMVEDNKEHIELLKSLNGKPIRDFNKWFNEMFESVKLGDDETDTGYGDWLKGEEEIRNEKVSLKDFGNYFEGRKKECKEIVLHEEIIGNNNGDGSNLVREKQTYYNSGIFSKLNYEDLRRAHTETVVPVTNEDFERKKKFKNVDEYKNYRNSMSSKPKSQKESREYFEKRNASDNEKGMRRAYNLLKRDEEIERAQDKWWKNLKRLKSGK